MADPDRAEGQTNGWSAPQSNLPPVVTIDGPSGTGKGTLRTRLASRLGFHMLDSGALYRALALWVDASGQVAPSAGALGDLARRLPIRFLLDGSELGLLIELDGKPVTDALRAEAVGAQASRLAALPEVRAGLLNLQRDFRQWPGLVADGRDMGTVVFPDAGCKIFLTASADVRAKRRAKQLNAQGVSVSLAQLVSDIASRDARDTERAVAPLRPAADALILDTSGLDIDAVEAEARAYIARRGMPEADALPPE